MIRINIMDPEFSRTYWRAHGALPIEHLESPRQYGQRWQETYRCRIDANSGDDTYLIFDRDEDYTWFMLRWA
jgi:hypothetical protein